MALRPLGRRRCPLGYALTPSVIASTAPITYRYPDGLPDGGADPADLRVVKMRFAKTGRVADRSTVVVNSNVTLRGIPEDAYRYEVNGKSAVEWVMDRYEVKTDHASGIVNDPNLWSDDPRYVIDLVARIVRVCVDSAHVVDDLPHLGI